MYRLCEWADLVCDDIYPAALAMLDGSYWNEAIEQGPPDYVDGGRFEVGGGDEG